MAADYKTRCPKCEAQFRISEEHLRQARGRVRCGKCLTVFLATDHLVGEPPAAPPAKAKAPEKPKWSLDAAPDDAHDENLAIPRDNKLPTPDEERNDTSVSMGGLELSDSFLSLDQDDEDGLEAEDFSHMTGAGKGSGTSTDESWAEELLKELEDDDTTRPIRKKRPPANQGKAGQQPAATLDDDDDIFPELDAFGDAADRDPFGEDSGDSSDAEAALDALLENPDAASHGGGGDFSLFGEDEVTELDVPPSRPEKKKGRISWPVGDGGAYNRRELLKWGSLSMVALLVLCTQFLVFSFNSLARTPQWRPLYATLCDLGGCTLPSRSDINALHGANLVVRSHPEVDNALIVDAIIYNKASYEQPFPTLELRFSTLHGRPIASRKFLPSEYLSTSLQDHGGMPMEVPVRISLEILDPGPEAVNYQLLLHEAPEKSS